MTQMIMMNTDKIKSYQIINFMMNKIKIIFNPKQSASSAFYSIA